MESLVITKTLTIGGTVYSESQTVQALSSGGGKWTLPADQPDTYPLPQPGVMRIRTSDTEATIGMENTNHQIVTEMVVDIYWTDDAGKLQVQYACIVGTVGGGDIAISSGVSDGVGSVLPPVVTDLTISPRSYFNLQITGDDLQGLIANCLPTNNQPSSAAASIITFDSRGTGGDVFALFVKPNQIYEWYQTAVENPLEGDTVVSVGVSHSSQGLAQTIQIDFLSN